MVALRVVRVGFLLLVGICLLVLPVRADSDGSFCAAKGYIAYELRSFHTTGLNAPHVLRIVRFDHGIKQTGQVAMEDFQVHELKCDINRIEIAGFDKMWIKYVLDVNELAELRIIDRLEEPAGKHPISQEGPAPPQLWVTKTTAPLESADFDYRYQLVFSRSENPINGGLAQHGGVDHYSKAELQQTDLRGNVAQRLLIYEDHQTE